MDIILDAPMGASKTPYTGPFPKCFVQGTGPGERYPMSVQPSTRFSPHTVGALLSAIGIHTVMDFRKPLK